MIDIPENYIPSDEEEFMNDMQIEYFRRKLLSLREETVAELSRVSDPLNQNDMKNEDIVGIATVEMMNMSQMSLRSRLGKLILDVDEALLRINNKTYGYCQVTNEPICVKRLDAMPTAMLSIHVQKKREQK